MIDASSIHRQPAEPKALPNDLVSELLLGMRLNGIQYRRMQAAPPFGIGFGNIEGGAQFHFIARGPVHLRSPDNVVHRLETGDAVLLPHGGPHELLSSPSESSRDIATFEAATL
ncbi:cupin domain-containing protein, partial [Halomonas elongata]|uniref:cupin domain-containing protein n=1 Tax=Halomonas elongata TaxID=2746 RepID=UPI00255B1DC2